MSIQFTVPLQKIIDSLGLVVTYMPEDCGEILISSADINRPGLQFAGFFDYFDNKRIQLVGKSEMAYLAQHAEDKQERSMEAFFSAKPSAVIISRGFAPTEAMERLAKQYGVPLLSTPEPTSNFSAALNSLLNAELAPRVTRHGVLVEVYGEGVLLLGDSGVGKSETAIELVKRGHRLIADDAVEIRRIDSKTLIGTSPENIRHFLELRGIGIINVRKIFGIGSVKVTEEINMLIHLELWNQNKVYDRMGVEDEFTDILGLPVPSLNIPVKPGRNLAIIIEVAAMNNRQKRMGYNAAHELLERLGMAEDIPVDSKHKQFDF
ncbi:MAG: HPr(Ser) kinase/phosphatase [Angelakisella sp.]